MMTAPTLEVFGEYGEGREGDGAHRLVDLFDGGATLVRVHTSDTKDLRV